MHLPISPKELQIRQNLKDDFSYYAENCLFIRPKTGQIRPFLLNEAQKYIHKKVEEQREKFGYVRAIILKGRQQGCSTYIEGRFFWRVSHLKGVKACIFTHSRDATNNLFDMAQRFYSNCPEWVRPSLGKSNAKEMHFDLLDSGYQVATAGNKSAGRSSTIQFLHASEVAFWENADEHAKGILNTVLLGDNTEIFLESTANGVGNYFHLQWTLASRGESNFIPIFVPWFWQEEYQLAPKSPLVLTEEENELKALYKLNDAQINWRRLKILDSSAEGQDGVVAFRQEYPCCATEAFQFTEGNAFIPAHLVEKAKKTASLECNGPLILGVDPAASENGDYTAIIRRQGRVAHGLDMFKTHDTMAIVGKLKGIIEKENPQKVFIDVGGIGHGLVDRLKEMFGNNLIRGVNFAESALQNEKYHNRRVEMWYLMKQWLMDLPVKIPDDIRLEADLTSVPYDPNALDSSGRYKLVGKNYMKQKGFKSPDSADALALTFAQPVPYEPRRLITPQRGFV